MQADAQRFGIAEEIVRQGALRRRDHACRRTGGRLADLEMQNVFAFRLAAVRFAQDVHDHKRRHLAAPRAFQRHDQNAALAARP